MNVEKQIIGMIDSGVSPYSLITTAMLRSYRASLTPAERKRNAERSRLIAEENRKQSMIRQSICPNCKGRLTRGKKDKKNNYKRVWACANCGSSHSI